MTQAFTDIAYTDIVGESLDPLKNRDQAAKTSFMGTSLPEVTSADVGMACVIIKTEDNIEYKQIWRLIGVTDNQPEWRLERDLKRGLVYSDTSEDQAITSYQPVNEILTSLSEQTAGTEQDNSNKFPYLSSKNTVSLADVTSLARQFLAAAAASEARDVLGLGAMAIKSTVSGSDLTANTVALSNMAKGTYNHVITYAANGQPTTKPMPAGVPVGSIILYPSTVLPDNSWLFLYGQQLLVDEYPELWAFASASNNIIADYTEWTTTRPGAFYQESATVFRVPDLRNWFIRGWDGPEGPTRVMGTVQGDAIRNITGRFSGTLNSYQRAEGAFYISNWANSDAYSSHNGGNGISFDASRQVPVAKEVRPKNIVIPYIMKAKSQAT